MVEIDAKQAAYKNLLASKDITDSILSQAYYSKKVINKQTKQTEIQVFNILHKVHMITEKIE